MFVSSPWKYAEEALRYDDSDGLSPEARARLARMLGVAVRALGATCGLLLRVDQAGLALPLADAGFEREPKPLLFACRTWAASLKATTVVGNTRAVAQLGVLARGGLRFCEGTPLVGPDGQLLGTMAVFGSYPRRRPSDDRLLLEELAGLVAAELGPYAPAASGCPAPLLSPPARPAGLPVIADVEVPSYVIQDGYFVYIDPALDGFCGYTLGELMSYPFEALVDEADRPRVAENLRRRLSGEVDILRYTLHVRHRDGTLREVEVIGTRTTYNGRPAISGTILDVTEGRRKTDRMERLHAFYEQILDQLPTQLAVFDLEGRYVYLTPSAIRDPEMRAWIVGRTNAEYFERRGIDQELGAKRDALIQKVIREKKGHSQEEQMRTRDGSTRHLIRMLTPIFDPAGEVVYVVGHALDVTERKAFEAQLITAMNRAEEMNNLKSAFLTNMSHEVRTPLTSILGFADILIAEIDDDRCEFAHLIRRSGERLMDTLNSVLDLAQLEGRTFRLTPSCLDVAEAAADALQLFRPQAEARGLALRFEQATPGALIVDTDRSALCRVLVNLVGNAIKFTKHGGVTIRAGADRTHVWIAVADTGIGIGEAFLRHLFDEFKQESTGVGRDYEGSGLGLSITKRLLDLMGGLIEVESEKGKGTTFTVRLPRA